MNDEGICQTAPFYTKSVDKGSPQKKKHWIFDGGHTYPTPLSLTALGFLLLFFLPFLTDWVVGYSMKQIFKEFTPILSIKSQTNSQANV